MRKLTLTDVITAGLCASGARAWCKLNGFEFRTLAREGLDLNAVKLTNCPLALRAVVVAEQRYTENGEE